MNSLNLFKARHLLKRSIADFFYDYDFIEVETPALVPLPGVEVHLEFFKTQWKTYQKTHQPLYLRSSPEPQMKQLIAEGLEKIFQIGPCFRNHGELTEWHHPEFMMLEWYEDKIAFEKIISFTEHLLRTTNDHLIAALKIKNPLVIPPKVARFTVKEAFKEFAGIELLDDDPDLGEKAKHAGVISINTNDSFETAFFKIIIDKIEPAFKQFPCAILYDYPPSQSALATISNGAAKRFEFYIHGIELCNGFEELIYYRDNLNKIHETNKRRLELSKEPLEYYHDFINALKNDLPACCGNALGFDRWLALILGYKNIDGVIPFRQQSPYKDDLYFNK